MSWPANAARLFGASMTWSTLTIAVRSSTGTLFIEADRSFCTVPLKMKVGFAVCPTLFSFPGIYFSVRESYADSYHFEIRGVRLCPTRKGNGTQEAQSGHKKHKKELIIHIFCASCVLFPFRWEK